MVSVGYSQEQHHSFRDFDDCEELRYLTLLVPLKSIAKYQVLAELGYRKAEYQESKPAEMHTELSYK